MGRIIGFLSGKGGVGKTTLVSNIGLVLAKKGKKTVCIDCNPSGPNLSLHHGVPTTWTTLEEALKGTAHYSEALYAPPYGKNNLHILPSSLSTYSSSLEGIEKILGGMVAYYDYILLDGAAGTGSEAEWVARVSDELFLVTTPELPSIASAHLAKKMAERLGKKIDGIIINQARRESTEIPPGEIGDVLEARIIGVIPFHDTVKKAVANGKPVAHLYPNSPVTRTIEKMVDKELLGWNSPGFWSRLFNTSTLLSRTE